MSEIKIPFGQSTDGTMVSIDTAIRGLACQCFCCVCNAPLVARKGEKNQHHFAHRIEPEHCAEARETALHKFAKKLICETLSLRLPDDLDLGEIQSAKDEEWLDGIRPDVLVQFDEPVAIEIFVAHRVPSEKIKTFVKRKLAALEIDLSSYHRAHKNEDEWRDLVLRTAHRIWLFPPTVVREQIELDAQEKQKLENEYAAQVTRAIQRAAEHREFIESKRREEQEWQRLVSESYVRARKEQEAAEAEYKAYQKSLKALEGDKLLEGLKICADTKFHLERWERRKRERERAA